MHLKTLIKNSEQRLISYKEILKLINQDKISFPENDEFVISYKDLVRENKNHEQVYLKKLVEEKMHENEGMSAPFCYPYKIIMVTIYLLIQAKTAKIQQNQVFITFLMIMCN